MGAHHAESLTERCEPVGARDATASGLVDRVLRGRRTKFESAVLDHALQLATREDYDRLLDAKRTANPTHTRAVRPRDAGPVPADLWGSKSQHEP